MKFVLGIKPTVITGWGTTFHAKSRIWESIRGCFCYSSKFGYAYVDSLVITLNMYMGTILRYSNVENIVKTSIM